MKNVASAETSSKNKFASYFLSVVIGIILGLLYNTLSATKPTKYESNLVLQEDENATLSPPKTCTATATARNSFLPSPSSSSSPMFSSCQRTPSACAALYHAFTLDSAKSAIKTEKNVIPKFLWRAILSAASLRSAHLRAGTAIPKILLASDYDAVSIIETAKNILQKVMKDVYSNSVCSEDMQFNASFLFDAKMFNQNTKKRNQRLILDLHFFDGCKNITENKNDFLNIWPFDEILYPANKSESPFQFKMKADGLDAKTYFPRLAEFRRLLYLDADTFIAAPVFEILDLQLLSSSSTSSFIGMVPEMNWHRDLSPFLYEPVLAQSQFIVTKEANDNLPPQFYLAEHSDANDIISKTSTSSRWWVPHHSHNNNSVKTSKSMAKPNKKGYFGQKNHAFYEIQYNTGLILIAPSSSEPIDQFISSWRHLHHILPRCKNDKVLWDQCSLPIAIRKAKTFLNQDLKIVALSDRFNFREALGYGCADSVYDQNRNKYENQEFLKQRVADGKVPKFASSNNKRSSDGIVVVHHTEFKFRQDEWITLLFD